MRNILTNAIKFSYSSSKIDVKVAQVNGSTIVEIIDTGIGMTQEQLKNISTSVVNESTLGTNDEKGSGLGISIIKENISSNNGTLEVDSTVGRGTTFKIVLPTDKP